MKDIEQLCTFFNYNSSLNVSVKHIFLKTESGHDYLTIHNGGDESTSILKKWSGDMEGNNGWRFTIHHSSPNYLYSSGTRMFLKFESDYLLEYKGFQAVAACKVSYSMSIPECIY